LRVTVSELVKLLDNLAEFVSDFGQVVDWDDTHDSLLFGLGGHPRPILFGSD
jgi:hypothetical protein